LKIKYLEGYTINKERIENILKARIVSALESATGDGKKHLKRLLASLEKKI